VSISRVSRRYDCAVRDRAVFFIHLLTTVARLAGPGGARSVVAESVLVKQQRLILNRSRTRSPHLRLGDRMVVGVCTLLIRPGRLIRSAIVLKQVGTLRAILRRLRLWATMQPDVQMLRTTESVGKALTGEEERRLLDACRTRRSRSLQPIVTLALHTGMRRGEIQSLRWHQIDFLNRALTVGASKTAAGTGRVIPLNDRALATLQNWATDFPGRKSDHCVFPTEYYAFAGDDRNAHAKTMDPAKPTREVKTAWKSAKEKAAVECRFHDLRHTACTRMLEGGASFPVVAGASTTAKMAKRYGHIGSDVQRAALAALDAPPSGAAKAKQSKGIQETDPVRNS